MTNQHRELDELDRAFDQLARQSPERPDDPLLAKLNEQSEALPPPESYFVSRLRADLLSRHPAESRTTSRAAMGIVATPMRSSRPAPWPRTRAAVLAAAVAAAFALFAFNAGGNLDGRHGFGVPTAKASATVEQRTPTPTATPVRPAVKGAANGAGVT